MHHLGIPVIGARIIAQPVGLHRVWAVLALAVSGFFYGFVGLRAAALSVALVELPVARALHSRTGSQLHPGPYA